MSPERFQEITAAYPSRRIGIAGDFCLDRYLEIDPSKQEISIETGLPVHNVVRVRSQPGAAGTILNNLAALGIGEIFPIGFIGEDGEGFELLTALRTKSGVRLDHFHQTDQRRTFTYCKPLVLEPGRPPIELNRLDSKNWTPTPAFLQGRLIDSVASVAAEADALILMDQVDLPETGVITAKFLEAIACTVNELPYLPIVADSRRSLRNYPPVIFKMNATELSALTGSEQNLCPEDIKKIAAALSHKQGRHVFVTLSEGGILGASPRGDAEHIPALPIRGPIDVVGAGDAVTANLTAALAAGGTMSEALELANAAASIVIHQLGTTGTATVSEIGELVVERART